MDRQPKRISKELNSNHGKERSHHTRARTHIYCDSVTLYVNVRWHISDLLLFSAKICVKVHLCVSQTHTQTHTHALSFTIKGTHSALLAADTQKVKSPRQSVHSVSLCLTHRHTHPLPHIPTRISHLLMTATNAY